LVPVVFVEVFRLLFVLAGALLGLRIGEHIGGAGGHAAVIGMLLGALSAYVLGGVFGRLLDRGLQDAVRGLGRMPPGEVFAGSVVGTLGLLLGVVCGLPLILLVHSSIDYPVVAAVSWVLTALGVRVGVAKGRELIRAVGLSHLLATTPPPPALSVLVETSALLDRAFLVLGRTGLLAGGVLLPEFVSDQVRSLGESPDPVAARRARRAMESLDVLRAEGIDVQVLQDAVPEEETPDTKALALAKRLGVRLATCSSSVAERAEEEGVLVVDLRRLTADLLPDHPTGERLLVDLVKEGRLPRQGVGYLADGDMVVVNDALHLVGASAVPVIVSSTRHTNQGVLVFARLAEDRSSDAQIAPGGDDGY
jgi:uncharacterized protein YacL